MNPLLLLGGGALLWWWSTRPPTTPGGPGTEVPPGGSATTLPPGTIVLPDGTTLPPGTTIPPDSPLPTGTTIVPSGGIVPPGVTLPGGSIVPSLTPPDTGPAPIPDPRGVIGLIRDVYALPTFTPAPEGQLDPALIDLPTFPDPDAVIGTIDVPGELWSIQQDIESMLGLPAGPDTALFDAIQSLTPDEAEAFIGLVADNSGLSFGAVQAGMSYLGLVGGPLAMGMGVIALTQGNAAGIVGIVGGIGVTLTSLAVTGAGAAMGIEAATLAAMGALGAGLSVLGGIGAVGILVHTLFGRGGIFDSTYNLPTAQYYSFLAGNAAFHAFESALASATSLSQLTAVASARWAPNGELQIGSTLSRFGWAGDADDAMSPEWARMMTLLRMPALVALGLPEIADFVHGLWVQGPGQSGDVPYNAEASYQLQRAFARALPSHPAYAAIKAAVEPGGDLWAAYQEWARVDAEWRAAQAALLVQTAAAIAASYGYTELALMQPVDSTLTQPIDSTLMQPIQAVSYSELYPAL